MLSADRGNRDVPSITGLFLCLNLAPIIYSDMI